MKKIIFIKVHPPYTVCPEEEWAKREYRERWLVRQTKNLGYDAKLFLLSNAKNIWVKPDEVEVVFFPVDDKSVAKQSHTSAKMLERLIDEKPDLIIFKGLAYKLSTWILNATKHMFKHAFIVGGHCHDENLSSASYVLAETQEQIDKHFSKLKCDILPKSLDLSIFKPNKEKIYDIVNVSTFEHRKNHQALYPLFERYRTALVGNGPDFLKVKAHINENVYLAGNVSTDRVAEIISKSKIMVHPSIWEGFPRVIIESLACEVPVVALSSTIKGIIENGKHGILTTQENLVDVVKKLLDDANLIKEMGIAGRKLVIEKFEKDSTISVLQKMYKIIFED